MATVQTFGVVAADLVRYVGGAALSATTSPTEDDVSRLIVERAAYLGAALAGIGVSTATLALDPTSHGYVLCARWIGRAAAADWVLAREHVEPDVARVMREQVAQDLKDIIERPAMLGDAQPVSDGAPGLIDSHVTRAAWIADATADMPLSSQLAWRGRM